VPLTAPRHFDFGGASLDVLAPLADYVPNDVPKNNDSMVVRVRYGTRTFLLTGDVERPIEYRMLDENEIQPVDVLKVAHHGSRTSSTESFLEAANPIFAIISVGEDNSYGHPNRDVLTRLDDHHAEVLRTDQHGLVTVRTDGKHLTVETRY
jgi:competence protein ComEC